jgi:hypothetical protein
MHDSGISSPHRMRLITDGLVYALVRFITVFLIKPGLKIKGSRRNGVTVVRFELLRKERIRLVTANFT